MSAAPARKAAGAKATAPMGESAAAAAGGGGAGLALLALMVAFVFFWLYRITPADDTVAPESGTDAAPAAGLDAFRDDAWLLPDEAMLGFVEVPAGTFIMGSDPLRDPMAYENERWSAGRRQGNPELAAFYIGRYEVTVAQFNLFAAQSSGGTAPRDGAPAYPATGATWPEALAYGRWLEARMRTSPATPRAIRDALESGWRITLPSEAQWEKAARGVDGRIFPWGSDPNAGNANFGGGGLREVTAGACPRCSYGLADMAGNVWEMTSSPLQNYPFNPAADDLTLHADALFVMRGGSFADAANNVRAAVRGAVDPGVRNPAIGFRLVISPP